MVKSMLLGHQGAKGMPAMALRPTRGMRGGMSAQGLGRSSQLLIQNEDELRRYVELANTPGNWAAYLSMRAYVHEAHLLQKEQRSMMQNAALLVWKTPNWVPAEARLLTKVSDGNVAAGVNTP